MKKKVLIIAITAALLAVIAAACLLLLPDAPAGKPAESSSPEEIYWNVDRDTYIEQETGLSLREPAEDGSYHIRFGRAGGSVVLRIADKKLVNFIDSMYVMGLAFDETGTVIDALDVRDVATRTADGFYVKECRDGVLYLNSSRLLTGMDMTVTLPAHNIVYDVSPTAADPGEPAVCQPMDLVSVYSDSSGQPTHVFITERPPEAGIYWRVEYGKISNGVTTRTPDENGVYTILFAHDGQQLELKCRDLALVNKIDSAIDLFGEFALQFDSEGYICNVLDAALALRSTRLCQDYHVTAIDGSTVTVTDISGAVQGTVKTFTLPETCDIYMCCDGCAESHVGERITELKLYDNVSVYTDTLGTPVAVFVARRMCDSPMYYNMDQQFGGYKVGTNRKPDKNGYYHFDMFTDGKVVKLRTDSEAIADRIDTIYDRCMGLQVNGDIIEKVYHARCVYGNTTIGTERYISQLVGSIYTAVNNSDFSNSGNGIISAQCKVYDLTTGYFGAKYGQEISLSQYDKVTGYRNVYGEAAVFFVTGRYIEGAKPCWNITRCYDPKNETTTRTPDENGYYVFEIFSEGKIHSYKTKNKKLASYIDAVTVNLVALKVNKSGIIQGAYPLEASIPYGYRSTSGHYVNKINKDGSFNTYWMDNGVKKMSAIDKLELADDCVIYNVSNGYETAFGEKTKLREGDLIRTYATKPDGKLKYIFIFGRELELPLYWNPDRRYDSAAQTTARTPDADGYYVIDLAVGGEIRTFKTKDKEIAGYIDSQTTAFSMQVKEDLILRIIPIKETKAVERTACGGYDIMTLDGRNATATRNRPLASNQGDTVELKFAKNCQFYDMSSYAAVPGSATTLQSGDRVTCYENAKGEVTYCFITAAHTRSAGHVGNCDHCDEDVFWEPYTGTIYNANAHYYLTTDLDSGSITFGDFEIVLDLNGKTLSTQGGLKINGAVSLMDCAGSGKLLSTGSAAGGCVHLQSGSFTLYSGTVGDGSAATVGGSLLATAATGSVNLLGGTVAGDIHIERGSIFVAGAPVVTMGGYAGMTLGETVKLTLGQLTDGASIVISAAGVFTGETPQAAVYQEYFIPAVAGDKITVEGNALKYEGEGISLTPEVPEGQLYVNFEGYGFCPVCQQTVKWIGIEGSTAASRVGDGKSGHYYLSGDTALPTAVNNFANAGTGKTLCLHLNGKNLTYGSRIAVAYEDSTVNIMGAGNVTVLPYTGTLSGNDAGLFVQKRGTLNLYGGTYTTTDPTRPALLVDNVKGTVNLYGSTSVDTIRVKTGKLNIGADWSGAAQVSFAAALVNGAVPTANGSSEGAFSGNLTLDGKPLVGYEGRLLLDGYQPNPYLDPLELDADSNGYCPVCQQTVKWIGIEGNTAASRVGDGKSGHYYLSGDTALPTAVNNFANAGTGKTLCLHLNGKNLTYGSRIAVAYEDSTVNIMGAGNVTVLPYTGTLSGNDAGLFVQKRGTLNLYGGTYTTADPTRPALLCGYVHGIVNVYSGVQITGGALVTAGMMNLYGNATIDRIRVSASGQLSTDPLWTGTAEIIPVTN